MPVLLVAVLCLYGEQQHILLGLDLGLELIRGDVLVIGGDLQHIPIGPVGAAAFKYVELARVYALGSPMVYGVVRAVGAAHADEHYGVKCLFYLLVQLVQRVPLFLVCIGEGIGWYGAGQVAGIVIFALTDIYKHDVLVFFKQLYQIVGSDIEIIYVVPLELLIRPAHLAALKYPQPALVNALFRIVVVGVFRAGLAAQAHYNDGAFLLVYLFEGGIQLGLQLIRIRGICVGRDGGRQMALGVVLLRLYINYDLFVAILYHCLYFVGSDILIFLGGSFFIAGELLGVLLLRTAGEQAYCHQHSHYQGQLLHGIFSLYVALYVSLVSAFALPGLPPSHSRTGCQG